MSVLLRCPSYGESNKRSTEKYGPTLGVCFTELSILWRVKRSTEKYGPTLGVCFTEVSVFSYRESNKGVQKGMDQL